MDKVLWLMLIASIALMGLGYSLLRGHGPADHRLGGLVPMGLGIGLFGLTLVVGFIVAVAR
ncbi:hypothetical protein [Salinarimonas soli]|uniref:Uncharacterized protein n=1 Tax=Salinarimonas soli TaxID=1638099 RepID=A0A5B2VDD3_9HYPH|nr:hypothetical protein [Salinarimonas soli]KAA2236422.1 hypothetical protein F0L46_14870 [Salinarimonas soli]